MWWTIRTNNVGTFGFGVIVPAEHLPARDRRRSSATTVRPLETHFIIITSDCGTVLNRLFCPFDLLDDVHAFDDLAKRRIAELVGPDALVVERRVVLHVDENWDVDECTSADLAAATVPRSFLLSEDASFLIGGPGFFRRIWE